MNNIASERVRASMTQRQLAEKLGVVTRTIRNWEKDETSVPSSGAREMAQLFGCSIDYLFGLTDERLQKKAMNPKLAGSHEVYGIG